MKIKFFRQDVKMPHKGHLPDSGIDIFQPDDFSINSLETKVIDLGLGVAIPEGHAGMLVPRSSIAAKGLIIQTSVIDPDYSANIHLIITNCSNNKIDVKKGDRLCSLVIYPVMNPFLEIVDELPNSIRGNNGLGSTGR